METTRASKYSVVRVFVDLASRRPRVTSTWMLGPVTAAVSQALPVRPTLSRSVHLVSLPEPSGERG